MKSEFLRELGITDQKIIDAIMAENGRDVNKVRKDFDEVTAEVDGLKAQLSERDGQLKDLKKAVKDNEGLTSKITELENANATMKTEYENKLTALKRDNEIESKLHAAKAKNIKAVKALLTDDKDVDEQIKALQAGSDTGFLFETGTPTPQPPAGTSPRGGNSAPAPKAELTFADRISNALNKK